MNYNICKNKCNQCCLKSIQNDSEEWWLYIIKNDDFFAFPYDYRFPIKKPLQKLLNQLSTNELKKEYYFYDKIYETIYTNMDDLLRNIEMEKNDMCPYYMEHLLSDIEHKERKKAWKKKMKLKNRIIKNGI